MAASRVPLSDDLAVAFKALDGLDDRVDFVTDVDELGDAVCELIELNNKLDATMARLVSAAERNGVPQASGQRTVGQYVAARTTAAPIKVNRISTLARWLRGFPLFESAFGTTLRVEHVDYLRKLDTRYATNQRLLADQQILIDAAATCSFKDFTKACDYWLILIDPDGNEPKDQIAKTSLRVRNGSGGRGEISGECDALTRQALSTAIDHEATKIRLADKEAGIARTQGQRQMAALVNLVTRGFAREDGTFPVPLVNVVMSLKVAEWAQETLAAGVSNPHGEVPVDLNAVDGRCELIDGTPIHPFLALFMFNNIGSNILGAPNLRRYVMEADSRLLDVSVNSRYFPNWMKTAGAVQSRGQCETHGCDAPLHWLQADHIDPVANGGETRFDNEQMQCDPDNHAKGATTGTIAWRDRTPPPRRKPGRRGHHRTPLQTGSDDADGDADQR